MGTVGVCGYSNRRTRSMRSRQDKSSVITMLYVCVWVCFFLRFFIVLAYLPSLILFDLPCIELFLPSSPSLPFPIFLFIIISHLPSTYPFPLLLSYHYPVPGSRPIKCQFEARDFPVVLGTFHSEYSYIW